MDSNLITLPIQSPFFFFPFCLPSTYIVGKCPTYSPLPYSVLIPYLWRAPRTCGPSFPHIMTNEVPDTPEFGPIYFNLRQNDTNIPMKPVVSHIIILSQQSQPNQNAHRLRKEAQAIFQLLLSFPLRHPTSTMYEGSLHSPIVLTTVRLFSLKHFSHTSHAHYFRTVVLHFQPCAAWFHK